jgi:hypothetical protein
LNELLGCGATEDESMFDMSSEEIEKIAAVISREYKSWGSSTDTYTGQRAVQSVAEQIGKALFPGDEFRQRHFAVKSGVAT